MPFEEILYDVAEGVATVTLNRPERLNAVTGRTTNELIEAFDRADADETVRAVIVTGQGRAIGAGAVVARRAPDRCHVRADADWLAAVS